MYTFKFADIGEGIHEGTVSEIFVKVGDKVKDGTDLFAVETDKITTEISSPVNGIVAKILIAPGDVIHVGQAIFEIDDQKDTASTQVETPKPAVETKPTPVSQPEVTQVVSEAKPQQENTFEQKPMGNVPKEAGEESGGASVVGEVKVSNQVFSLFGSNHLQNEGESVKTAKKVVASPVAKSLAKQHHVDLTQVVGTGPNGRISKEDVLNYVAKQSAKPSFTPESVPQATSQQEPKPVVKQPESVKPVVVQQSQNNVPALKLNEGDKHYEMTTMRKAISRALKRSWNNVAYTNLAMEVDVTEIFEQRQKLKDLIFETEHVKLTLLPFVVKAIAKALVKFPLFNALVDDATGTLVLKKDVNVGIAVDTKDGLIVPNVKHADQLSILEIAKKISAIAQGARTKKIQFADLQNGTFSISNYGSLGVSHGVPVINYPEVAIAGLGTLTNKIKKIGINMVERKVMYLTVAADHRWLDGGDIARFLNQVKQYLENITLLFL